MLGDLLRVLTSRIVVVGQDDNSGTAKRLGVFVSPLARPAGIRGCHEPTLDQVIPVLLALDEPDRLARRYGGEYPRQVVEDAAGSIQAIGPTASPVRPPLAKFLGIEADDFEEEAALLVVIGVAGDDPVGDRTGELQPEALRQVRPSAPGPASVTDPGLLLRVPASGRMMVIMGRAEEPGLSTLGPPLTTQDRGLKLGEQPYWRLTVSPADEGERRAVLHSSPPVLSRSRVAGAQTAPGFKPRIQIALQVADLASAELDVRRAASATAQSREGTDGEAEVGGGLVVGEKWRISGHEQDLRIPGPAPKNRKGERDLSFGPSSPLGTFGLSSSATESTRATIQPSWR
jgi:hypothetical protein